VRRCCALTTAQQQQRPLAAVSNIARRAFSSPTEQQPGSRREDDDLPTERKVRGQKKKKTGVPRDRTAYPIYQALEKVFAYSQKDRRKFDETVDLALSLNLDPRKPHQSIKTTVELPHGVGKSKRVAVFVNAELEPEFFAAATDAGADVVGGQELVRRLEEAGLAARRGRESAWRARSTSIDLDRPRSTLIDLDRPRSTSIDLDRPRSLKQPC
jgi:hypothetical protein